MLPNRPQPRVTHQPIPLGNLDPDAVKVVRRLVRYHHLAYLVGGCVRDLLLGYRPKDFDVATSARPPELRQLFRNCRIIGRRFRLAHMIFPEGKIIEVATFRRDPPQAQDSDSLLVTRDNVFGDASEDARRRDFTINGLFYDVTGGRIIDYVNGLPDVERRLVRTIGDPDIRLQEDPLRLLRAIRFTARRDLGMAPDLYAAGLRHRHLLERAAAPRLFEEVLRLLRGGAAHRSVWLAWEMGALAEILPELHDWLGSDPRRARRTFALLRSADSLVRSGRTPSDTVFLAALLHGPLVASEDGGADLGVAIRDKLLRTAERFAIPRTIRENVRQVLIAQRRLAHPEKVRESALPRREYYSDAMDFFEITWRARSGSDGEIDAWRKELAPRIDHSTASDTRPRRRGGRRRAGRRDRGRTAG
jgi:poly(A) polymerase